MKKNKIGDIVKCIDDEKDVWLKSPLKDAYYTIVDPNKFMVYDDTYIAIKIEGDTYNFPSRMFVNISLIRNEKINKILKNGKI